MIHSSFMHVIIYIASYTINLFGHNVKPLLNLVELENQSQFNLGEFGGIVLLCPLEEFSLADHQDQRTKRRVNHKYGIKPLYKEEANEFNEVQLLAYVLRAEGRRSYLNN